MHTFRLRYPLIFLLILITFSLAIPNVYSQCNPTYQNVTMECEDAQVVCMQNACYEMIDHETTTPNAGWCGPNTVLNNPNYLAFIPIQENVEITIHVDWCNFGFGLQAAIIGACPWTATDVIDCDPSKPPGGTMDLSASGLIPGETYWLVVDGTNGDVCAFTIQSVTGVLEYEITEELDPALTTISADSVCQGYEEIVVTVGPDIPNAHGYYWVLGWNGETITSTLPEIHIDIPDNEPAGIYTICARAFSGCDTTDTEVCTQLEIFNFQDVIKETAVYCVEDFPFLWHDLVIHSPGTFSQTFNNENGCVYDSIWTVDAYPDPEPGVLHFTVCDYQFQYEGEVYDNPGTYLRLYPKAGVNGCDSLLELTLEFGPFTSFIEMNCSEGFVLLNQLVEQWDPADSLSHAWYNCGLDTLLSNFQAFEPDSAGCYCLITSGALCQDTVCAIFSPENCHDLCSLVGDYHCQGTPVEFALDRQVSDQAIIDWRIFHSNQPDFHREGVDTFSRVFTEDGLYDVFVTVIDSGIATTCYDFFIIETRAEASLCCDQQICEDCTIVTISTSGPLTDIELSDGFETTLITGISESADVEICPPHYPYTLSIQSVSSSLLGCEGTILADSSITISRVEDIEIEQHWDTLCIDASGATSIRWYSCSDSTVIAEDACFVPAEYGCYCVEVVDSNDCVLNDCYEMIIDANKR